MKEFKDWKEIRDWCKEHGYSELAKRMQLNNDCWNSSGEFGRSQVFICDWMRSAKNEEERHIIAKGLTRGDDLIDLALI